MAHKSREFRKKARPGQTFLFELHCGHLLMKKLGIGGEFFQAR
jgi:hypothetical protein